MMEIRCTFTIFIIFITICLVKTQRSNQNGIIPIFVDENENSWKKTFEPITPKKTETIISTRSFSTTPTPRAQLRDLITFRFSNAGLKTIGPDFITSDNIISLSLDDNEISSISALAFRAARNLMYLNLSGNKIPTEKLLSFAGVTRLQTLIINNNNPMNSTNMETNYSNIDYGVFEQLKHLQLRNSQLKDFKIHYLAVPVLTHLYLSNNSIESSDIIFNNIPITLKNLYLDNNLIDRVEQKKLRLLQNLVMDNNAITEVCLDNCTKTKFISLRDAVNMKSLSLSRNKISVVSADAFTDTKQLESLDLSGNKITKVITGTFNKIVRLNKLSLADNQLTSVPDICLLRDLKNLNLSGNNISTIYVNSFCYLQSLKSLHLANNNINVIGSRAFENLPALIYLDLSGNKLWQLPVQWMNNIWLEELHLEKNYFEELDNVMLTNNMQKLKNVYLDKNLIVNLKVGSFKSLPTNLRVHIKNMRIEDENVRDYDLNGDENEIRTTKGYYE